MDPFDPGNLSLPTTNTKRAMNGEKPPRHRPGEKFLKGPVPWKWLSRAAIQPGRALHVAITIWFMAGIKNNRRMRLPSGILRDFSVSRYSEYRALNNLESAGLISVNRKRGRNPIITILEVN